MKSLEKIMTRTKIISLGLALYFAPFIAFGYEKTFKGLVYAFVDILGMVVPVIFALSMIVFMWGIFKYIFLSGGDEKQIAESRNIIFYGVIGIFVMVSVWGLVNFVTRTFFI